ncbi:MAG: SUMF1/EgtB/PvdO family nonheme iron enzyme, partial [Oligoflexus sp.]|nr:SUMF1/EgtB/PvdO family nonheme iron enzyme [Oligoflexus sp.]
MKLLSLRLDLANQRRNHLMWLRIFAFLAFAIGPLSCNSLDVFSNGSIASRKFVGVDDVRLTEAGKLQLSWTSPSAKPGLSFQVDFIKAEVLPLAFESITPTAASSLTSATVDLEQDDSSLVWNSLATVTDETTYTFDEAIELGSYYIFRVTDEKSKLSKRHLLAVKAQLSAPPRWQIISAKDGISIVWDLVPGASSYKITGLTPAKFSTPNTYLKLDPYSAEVDYSLCIAAAHGILTSSSCTPVLIPANLSRVKAISVTTSLLDGFYKRGTVIPIAVKFSSKVFLAPHADLSLQIKHGATMSLAPYGSGSGTDTLIFSYSVRSGQDTIALDAVSLFSADNPKGLLDEGGRPLLYSLPSPPGGKSLAEQKQIEIDTEAPMPPSAISFVSPISATLSFDVSWMPGIDAHMGGYRTKICSDGACSLTCGPASVLSPLLTATKVGVDGTSYFACVQAEDLAGNLSAWVASASPVTVQTSAPLVSSVSSPTANGIFKVGDVLPIWVVYSSNVYVTNGNDFSLTLETGATDRSAVYSSGSGSNTLVFLYTVQAGDTASDLNYLSPGALSLGSSGALKSAAGVGVSLALPALAALGSLGTLKNFIIDTTAPSLPSSVGFASAFSTGLNLVMNWVDSTDTNARYHNVKICAANDCASGCFGLTTDLLSPVTIAGLNGSSYYGCVQGEDLAGNLTPWVPSVSSVTIDTTLPTVTHISSPTADGFYKQGTVVLIDVTFSEPVYVTSPSDLSLAMAAGSNAVYSGGSGSSILRFTYTVGASDTSPDLDVAGAGALSLVSLGAIKDAAGSNANLTLPTSALSSAKAIVIDTTLPTAPTAVGFAGTKNSSLDFPVTWTNSIDANLRRHDIMICAASDCTTSCSSPVYQLLSPATVTGVNGGVYYACVRGEDSAGNVSAWIPSGASLTVDTSAPTVLDVSSSSANGSYKTGDTVDLTVQFSKAVYALSSEGFGLLLETGATDRTANYLSGSGTATLSFRYTVQPNDESTDLNVTSTTSLTLTGSSSLKDDAGNSAVLTLPSIVGANSIATHKALVIDGVSPSAPSSVGFSGVSSTSSTFNMAWLNSTDNSSVSHNTKLCAANDCSSSCISLGTSAVSPKSMTGVNGGSYYGCVQGQDAVGNKSSWVASLTPITVDTSVPMIINVSSTATNGYFKAGAVIPITLTFSENVYVANEGNFRLTLETGALDTQAVYASGSGSSTLTFNYTVAAGDNSADLDPIGTMPLTLGTAASIQDAGGNNASLSLPVGGSSLAGQKALVIDTTLPTLPSAISFADAYSLSPTFLMSWTSGTDTNFQASDVKLCLNSGCSTSCVSPTSSVISPASVTGVVGTTYYGCVQSRDLSGNVSGFVASASPISVEALPSFAGVVSGEVLGSWADGTGKLELTFGATPAASIQKYEVFYSGSLSYGSFDLSNPIATIPYGDPTYDTTPTDTKLLVSVPVALLKDGYYYVRYSDANGKYVDPNRSISSLVYVLKGTPGYALIPKKFSSLAYDFYLMRYEASLSSSGTNAGGDTVTSTEANLTGCSYKFHVDGTVTDPSCGSKVITKAAESLAGVTPQASISWPTAYYACRNASNANAKVRLPTAEEWRRASKWIGTNYASMWTTYSNNAGGNCNVSSGSAAAAGSAALCKNALGLQDMAGNLREWVDNRMLQYSISGNAETRFSYGPTIGRTLPNGIDNIVRRFHKVDPGTSGLAMTLGADFKTPSLADQKQYGAEAQGWTDPSTTSDTGIGFRCLGFRADTMPTMSQLALPDEPKFKTADLATAGLVPENFFVKDNRWEEVAITVDGITTDAVAEGRVNVTWQPWSKTTCNTSGTCAASDAGLVYKLYRFTEPNHQSIRTPMPWALGNSSSNYASDKPLDPLAVDTSGARLFTSSSSDGTLIATISNCVNSTPANCTFADLSTKDGGSLLVGKIYNYILAVEDASGNAVTPMVQHFRSPYFAGPPLSSASAFRMEPRLRRAAVFLVDEFYQQYQTRPEIMVHVPMEKSGLDHDFFIQKYEGAIYSGSVVNNPANGAGFWPLQGTAAAWVSNAAQCHDLFLQTGTFNLSACGNGSAINPTTATVQSKQGVTPRIYIDQGASWKACRYTTIADSDGKNYSLQLPSDPEWFKAADWGDSDQDGTIEASLNPFTGSVATSTIESGAGDNTSIRCHTDYVPAGFIMNTNTSGAGSTATCRSRYGAADMVGNVWEFTTGQIDGQSGLDNGIDGLWYGHSFHSADVYAGATTNYDLFGGFLSNGVPGSLISSTNDFYWQGAGFRASR